MLEPLVQDPDAQLQPDGLDFASQELDKVAAIMSAIVALLRALKKGETRQQLAKKCINLVDTRKWQRLLPPQIDMMLKKAAGQQPAAV